MECIYIEQTDSVFEGKILGKSPPNTFLAGLKLPLEFVHEDKLMYKPKSRNDPVVDYVKKYKDEIKFKFSPIGEYPEGTHINGVLLSDMCQMVCSTFDFDKDDHEGYSRAHRLYKMMLSDYWSKKGDECMKNN